MHLLALAAATTRNHQMRPRQLPKSAVSLRNAVVRKTAAKTAQIALHAAKTALIAHLAAKTALNANLAARLSNCAASRFCTIPRGIAVNPIVFLYVRYCPEKEQYLFFIYGFFISLLMIGTN